jgi:hypothetical protein
MSKSTSFSSLLTLVIPVSLNVPVGVGVTRVVLLGASNLNLLETPLRKVDVASPEVAAKDLVLETESSGESPDLAAVARSRITNNLNLPVVLVITNSQVTVAGNFLVASGDGGSDVMRVQVAASLSVDKSNDGVVTNESEITLRVVVLLSAVRVEEPIVVSVLVVVASNLLLLGTLGVGLNVRVKKTTTVAHVLDSSARTNRDLERAVLSNLGTLEVSLEEGAHLSITRAGAVENGEVQGEREEIDEERDDDEANNTGDDVGTKSGLWMVSKVQMPVVILLTTGILVSPNFRQRSSMV